MSLGQAIEIIQDLQYQAVTAKDQCQYDMACIGLRMRGFDMPPYHGAKKGMSNNDRPWVREHGTRHGPAPLWHYYPEVYGAAICGHPQITGMPLVVKHIDDSIAKQACQVCFQQMVVTSVMD